MKTELFDFHLPPQLIAQEPMPERDEARLLLIDRAARSWSDRRVGGLPDLLRSGDLLVLNDTRVIPARLRAVRDSSGGKVEFLLLPPDTAGADAPTSEGKTQTTCRRVLTKSGGKLKLGESFTLASGCKATLVERNGAAGDAIEIECAPERFERYVSEHGEVPLPPYIRRPPGPSAGADRQRYQTVFARSPGAVAAPTAGLHFSERLLERIRARGAVLAWLTLHVGPGTFRPVKAERVEDHFIDAEPYIIPAETLAAVRSAKRESRRVVAVGTTSLRALESAAEAVGEQSAPERAIAGKTNLFLYPPSAFRVVDALLTNFHLPKSSLLMLACAFAAPGSEAGIGLIQQAYAHAVEAGFRFYSYGDVCLIV